MSLAWVVVVGVVGICVFAEMSGRVAAVCRRATFDLVRERLGPRVGLLNLLGSMAVTLLTFVAEIGGVALALQLIVSVHYVLLVPLVAALVWLILWKAKFSLMENVLGLPRTLVDRLRRRAVAASTPTGPTSPTSSSRSTSRPTSPGPSGPTTPSRCSVRP